MLKRRPAKHRALKSSALWCVLAVLCWWPGQGARSLHPTICRTVRRGHAVGWIAQRVTRQPCGQSAGPAECGYHEESSLVVSRRTWPRCDKFLIVAICEGVPRCLGGAVATDIRARNPPWISIRPLQKESCGPGRTALSW